MPEPRQAVRLDDKEEDDQGAEHHEFQVRDDLDGDLQPEQGWHVAQQDRQQHDEGGAEEGAEDRAETADDDHEQNLEDRKSTRLNSSHKCASLMPSSACKQKNSKTTPTRTKNIQSTDVN